MCQHLGVCFCVTSGGYSELGETVQCCVISNLKTDRGSEKVAQLTKCLWYSVEDLSSNSQPVLSVIPVSAQQADTEGFPELRGYLVIYLGSRRDLIE